jgi:HEAT repeat protein
MDLFAPKISNLATKHDVVGLIKALKNKNAVERGVAAFSLGELGDRRAVESLCSLFADTDSGVRFSAASSLGKLGDPLAVEPLCRALTDPDSNVRGAAVEALGKIGDTRAVDPLCAAQENNANIFIRPKIILALAKIGDTRAVPYLCAALHEKDWRITVPAANALARIGDLRAVEPLCAAIKDTRIIVFVSAAMSLARIRDARAIKPLFALLTMNRRSFLLRRIAAAAIGRIGGPEAVELLQTAMGDHRPEIAAAAAEVLARLGDARSFKPLCASLKEQNVEVRLFAAEALGILGDARAVVPLSEAVSLNRPETVHLSQDEGRAEAAAVRSLGKIGDRVAVDMLEKVLQFAKWDVSGTQWGTFVAAAEALARLGNSRAGEALRGALANSNWQIRLSAAEALARIGDRPASEIEDYFAEAAGCSRHAIDAVWQAVFPAAQAFGKGQAVPDMDETWYRCLAVVEAIACIGDPRAIDMLCAIMSVRHLPPDIRATVGGVLCRIGDPRAVEEVLSVFDGFELGGFYDEFYRLVAAVMAKEIHASSSSTETPEAAEVIRVEESQKGAFSMESIQLPVFQFSRGQWAGPDQTLAEKIRQENKAAIDWFNAQHFVPIPEWGGAGVAANYCFDMACQAQDTGNVREAWAGFHQALWRFYERGDEKMTALTCFHLGKVYGVQEKWELAWLMFRQSAHLSYKIGDQKGYAWSLFFLGDTSDRLGDRSSAKEILSAALPAFRQFSPADAPGIEAALRRLSAG